MTKTITGFKGFDKDLKCREFQYEIGREYSQESAPDLCNTGFHFCEVQISVFSYYPLKEGNQYAVVEALGKIDSKDDKSATDRILIKSKIDIAGMVKASVEIIWNKAKKGGIFKKGHATSGNDGIACSVGRKASAKASLGCWIVLAEWKEGANYTDAKPIGVISGKIDGKKLKADTWYHAANGKFVIGEAV